MKVKWIIAGTIALALITGGIIYYEKNKWRWAKQNRKVVINGNEQ